MKLRGLSWLISALLVFSVAASAQRKGKFEISPFAGWESSGSFPVQTTTVVTGGSFVPTVPATTSTVDRLRLDSSLAYGAYVDYAILEQLVLEGLWAHNQTTYSQHDFSTGLYSFAFDSHVDQVEFGVLYPFRFGGFYYTEDRHFEPFVAGGVGFTHESNGQGNPNRTSFAFNLGGGAKLFLSKNFGLRGDIRYMPTYANTTNGVSCDFFGNCFSVKQRNFQNRAMFTGGIILRF